MSTFLTKPEVIELTGRKQKIKQIEQLTLNRIPFTVDAFGWPKVLRRAIELELSFSSTVNKSGSNDSELYLGD